MKYLLNALLKILDRPSPPRSYPEQSDEGVYISLFCKSSEVRHLDSLTLYYESDYSGIISRGLWLLSTLRNTEISSKKLAIIEIDEESGQVLQITPISVM